MFYSCIKISYKRGNDRLFSPCLLLADHLNISFPPWPCVAGELYIFRRVTPKVCCSQHPMTLWYTLRHPWGQKKETEGPAFSCPSNSRRTYTVQPPVPAWVSITGSDRSIWQECCPAGCPSSLSFWPICTSIGPCSCGCCFCVCCMSKKSQKPQRKCKYPLMALIQMDAPVTIAPLRLWFGFFVSEKHRGHHNNTAKLCMQDKAHWRVKEHCQLLW